MRLASHVLSVTMLAAILASQPLSGASPPPPIGRPAISGSATGSIGRAVEFAVIGLPPINPLAPFAESWTWTSKVGVHVEPPTGGKFTLTRRYEVESYPPEEPASWGMRLVFIAESEGVYDIVVDYNVDPFVLLVHRVVIGQNPQPPPITITTPPISPPSPPVQPTGSLWEFVAATVQSTPIASRVVEAKSLADIFRAAAKAIEEGGKPVTQEYSIETREEGMKYVADATGTFLKSSGSSPAWRQFFVLLQQELRRREAAGEIAPTVQGMGQAFGEITKGLEMVQ